jgi:hypothetical protein
MPQTQNLPASSAEQMLAGLPAGLQQSGATRPAEDVSTLKFAFHAWADINNRDVHGVRFHMAGYHAFLRRMELIFIPTLEVPKIRPKNNGFAVGKVTPFGVSAAAGVGSDVSQALQLPSETCAMIIRAYGEYGLTILESLTAVTPEEKLESILLFEGVMRTEEGIRGVDVIQEDLPRFLREAAPRLLEKAIKEGVVYQGEVRKVERRAREKGLGMIGELESAAATTNRKAISVLNKTKNQLAQARAGVNDSKAIADQLDNFLLRQHPSFSLDTDVERVARANSEVIEAIRGKGAADSSRIEQLLEQNNQLIGLLLSKTSSSPQK